MKPSTLRYEPDSLYFREAQPAADQKLEFCCDCSADPIEQEEPCKAGPAAETTSYCGSDPSVQWRRWRPSDSCRRTSDPGCRYRVCRLSPARASGCIRRRSSAWVVQASVRRRNYWATLWLSDLFSEQTASRRPCNSSLCPTAASTQLSTPAE